MLLESLNIPLRFENQNMRNVIFLSNFVQAKHAQDKGASAIASIPPVFYKAATVGEYQVSRSENFIFPSLSSS